MKKIIRNSLIISGAITLGVYIGYRITEKVLSKRSFDEDDVEYIKTPNDHIIIKVEEDDNLNSFDGDDIDVSIPEMDNEDVNKFHDNILSGLSEET